MFEKEGQRFLIPGIKGGVPQEVQLLLWHLIDASDGQMDYLFLSCTKTITPTK